ncbi:MAG: sodium-dependent transporter [Longimonas sp.]|uniref:sodium-dependent transporter n=1 Tax=Longimonas sp. TaxID=2039626 RepID=UPI00335AFE1B
MSSSSTDRFSTRWALILSVLGIAVGTGNIWRFPRIAAETSGETGAGAFLVAWILFLFMWSIPLIIAEYAMGRKGRMGIVGSYAKVAGRHRGWMGGFIGVVTTAIMFYYAVVAGWCLFYFWQMLAHPLPLSNEAAQEGWEAFQAGGTPVFFHAIAVGVGALAVWKGVSSIERVNRVLIPTLLGVLLLALARTFTLPGAWEGIAFLFTPEWALLGNPELWLQALTQNAWDTGAGWGLILTYGAYMQAKHGVVSNAFITGIGNNIVSLIAAIIIFGTVFAVLGTTMSQSEVLNVMQTSGPAGTGLTFIWMPQLFEQMAFGRPLAMLFFLGLSFAALSSLISMIELATRSFVDAGVTRATAVSWVAGLGFVLGIPSAVSLDIFANQDFVWGVGLLISGALVALAVLTYGPRAFRTETMGHGGERNPGAAWDVLITYFVPLQAVVVLGWWIYQSIFVFAPDTWFNPLDPFSIMTCLVQWTLAAVVLWALNDQYVNRMFARESSL